MYIYGASGHGKVILDILRLNEICVSGFIDDNSNINTFCDHPVQQNSLVDKLIIAIGDNRVRKFISTKYQDDNFIKLFHPRSIIAIDSTINTGSVTMAGAVVNSAVTIGKHVIINSNATVEHDCEIKDFAHISPGSTLCGNVSIGEGTHIGANAVVIPGIKIGKWCRVGAGAVVISDLPDYCTVVGNPARIIKMGNEA